MTELKSHVPVLLQEACEALQIKSNGVYIDCTFGRGGHSEKLLETLSTDGCLFVLDQDPTAIKTAQEKFGNDTRVKIIHESFENLQTISSGYLRMQQVDGILFDLGVSSPQLDEAHRGFSYSQDGPLDMRMNTTTGITAQQWLASVEQSELTKVLFEYGEEKYAKKIARRIIEENESLAISTTRQLAKIVSACYPPSYRGIHPATRTFQAIRIYINNELGALEKGLQAAFSLLATSGRLAVISFHSLEDRLVKRFIRNTNKSDELRKFPMIMDMGEHLRNVGKLIRPGEAEVEVNPRARSARLRVAEKVAG